MTFHFPDYSQLRNEVYDYLRTQPNGAFDLRDGMCVAFMYEDTFQASTVVELAAVKLYDNALCILPANDVTDAPVDFAELVEYANEQQLWYDARLETFHEGALLDGIASEIINHMTE